MYDEKNTIPEKIDNCEQTNLKKKDNFNHEIIQKENKLKYISELYFSHVF